MQNVTGGALYFLGIITTLLGFVTMVFWMYVGWRAMRAHEELAQAVGDAAARERA